MYVCMWRTWERTELQRDFGGKREGKRLPGRLVRRWQDNITTFLKEMDRTEWCVFVWLKLGASGWL